MTNRNIRAWMTSDVAWLGQDTDDITITLGLVCSTISTSEALSLANDLLQAAHQAEQRRAATQRQLNLDTPPTD